MARSFDSAFVLSYHTLEKLQLCPIVDEDLALLKRNFTALDLERRYSLGINDLFISGQKANVMYNRVRAGQLLKRMDLDRDERVSYDEYVNFYLKKWTACEPSEANKTLFRDHCETIYNSMVQPSNYFNLLPRELWNLIMCYLELPSWLAMQRVRAQWRLTFAQWRPDRPILQSIDFDTRSVERPYYLHYTHRCTQEVAVLTWKGFSPATHRFSCPGFYSFVMMDFRGSPVKFFRDCPHVPLVSTASNEYEARFDYEETCEKISVVAINPFGYVCATPKTFIHRSPSRSRVKNHIYG